MCHKKFPIDNVYTPTLDNCRQANRVKQLTFDDQRPESEQRSKGIQQLIYIIFNNSKRYLLSHNVYYVKLNIKFNDNRQLDRRCMFSVTKIDRN